ncbi:hypothetical protein DER44DRAFT_886458 [Fusarium oxysporum]|nr:hypothetical protein DER44DRAFT_886458 [Fusarium oxysporum]
MEEKPLPDELIKSKIMWYREHLCHMFPLPGLDSSLIDAYRQEFIESPPKSNGTNDKRLFQLPFITALCIIIPLGKSLKELKHQTNSGDSIERLENWMSRSLLTMSNCTPSLPLIRALLLATLCYQYEGELISALQCFHTAISMFKDIIMDLGGEKGIRATLAPGELQDLTLVGWNFSNFVLFDYSIKNQISLPLLEFDSEVVRNEFGKEAEDRLRCEMLKARVARLQCSCMALEQLPEMIQSIETLPTPRNLTSGSILYHIDYFESVQLLADTFSWAVSAYKELPEDQRKLLPEPSRPTDRYTGFIVRTLKQSQELPSLERKRLILFELSALNSLKKIYSSHSGQLEVLTNRTFFFLQSHILDDFRLRRHLREPVREVCTRYHRGCFE